MKRYNYSVALCTYNGQKYIREQLESIIRQNYKPYDIVISDDGSSDRTLEIAKEVLAKEKIQFKIVSNTNKKGVTGNFTNAIALCKSEYIFTSDQDDVWLPNKAETMMHIFETNKNAMLIFSDGELVDENLNLLQCNMWKSVGISDEMLQKNNWFFYLLNRCFVTGAAMAFKKELFELNEYIPECWLHDGWLAWKAAARGGLVPCSEKLILYRQHGNNVVGMNSVTSYKRIKKYFKNFKLMKEEHIIRYDRYKAVNDSLGICFDKKQKNELNKCISFWETLKNADSGKRMGRMRVVFINWKQGNFKKYSNGNRGAFRELLLALFDG